MSEKRPDQGSVNRRGFLRTSAVAAGGVAATATPFAAMATSASAAALAPARPVHPSTAAPAEPIIAYLRDAASSEVTVMSGTFETTYRDPVLAKRLLDAARQNSTEGV